MRTKPTLLAGILCLVAMVVSIRQISSKGDQASHRMDDPVSQRPRQSAGPLQAVPGQPAPWKQLEQWAARDPQAALRWLTAQDGQRQFDFCQKAWRGAIAQPDLAIAIAGKLIHTQPASLAELHGRWLAVNLAEAGMADRAIAFALSAPEHLSGEWYRSILSIEFARAPDSAVALWQQLPEGSIKENAWTSLAAAWSRHDPAALCAYLAAQPAAAPGRAAALMEGSRAWSLSDPPAYAEWLNSVKSQEDFDAGMALLVGQTDSLFRSTTEALGWTEAISNPELRLASTAKVLKQWAADQPEEVKSWIASAQWLDENDRTSLLRSSLQPSFIPAD